jgi:DNA-directed RNA polymerase subunit RPC12/RpoP
MRQPEFAMMPTKERKPAIKRAHVCDAGEGHGDHMHGASFQCSRCEWQSKWLCFDNITEIRRGIPCPNCNKD